MLDLTLTPLENLVEKLVNAHYPARRGLPLVVI
jgi:hypothetical protein